MNECKHTNNVADSSYIHVSIVSVWCLEFTCIIVCTYNVMYTCPVHLYSVVLQLCVAYEYVHIVVVCT